MVFRPRTRQLRRAVVVAALGALVVPATAGAAAKQTPVVTKVTPQSAYVGSKLTITGKNFKRGKAKNSVQFRADGGKTVFVKADVSTAKKLTVKLPETLVKYMVKVSGQPVATRFRVRILSAKLGKSYTALKASPLIAPKPAADTGTEAPPVVPVLDDNADCDGDGLLNKEERDLGTKECTADTDGDGAWDSYEYWSAIDLNRGNWSTSLPYAGKRPYPNPLDAADANTDHDGDSMTLVEEFQMWLDPRYGNKSTTPTLFYSAGKQKSRDVAAPDEALLLLPLGEREKLAISTSAPTLGFLDVDRNGKVSDAELLALDVNRDRSVSDSEYTFQDLNSDDKLSDDERDVDADGLINFDESHGRMLPDYWAQLYLNEKPYTAWVEYKNTDFLDPDTDGDGALDALDDQDHDGFSNIAELSRRAAQTTSSAPWSPDGRVNPLNPCLPATADPLEDASGVPLTARFSPSCMRHPPITNGPAPFSSKSPTGYAILD